jgi:hypothetical protein
MFTPGAVYATSHPRAFAAKNVPEKRGDNNWFVVRLGVKNKDAAREDSPIIAPVSETTSPLPPINKPSAKALSTVAALPIALSFNSCINQTDAITIGSTYPLFITCQFVIALGPARVMSLVTTLVISHQKDIHKIGINEPISIAFDF